MSLHRIKRIGASLLLCLSLFASASPAVYAAAGDPPQQSIDSITGAAKSTSDPNVSGMGMLRQVFGSIVDNPLAPATAAGGGDASAPSILGNVFGVLNMSILAIGSIFLTYNVTAGVAQTAQDGEFLGKRFSTLWVPIRLVSGVVTLVPVFHGWALAQLIILWFSVMGVGIGNLATTEVIKWIANGQAIVIKPASPSAIEFVKEVYKMNLCMSGMNAVGGTVTSTFKSGFDNTVTGTGVQTISRYNYGSGVNDATCGRISVPETSKMGTKLYDNGAKAAYLSLDAAAKVKTDALIKSINDSMGKGSGVTSYAYSSGDIPKLAADYQALIQRNPPSIDIRKAAANLGAQGFIGLGAYFSSLAKSGSQAGEAASLRASVDKSSPDPSTLPNADLYAQSLLVIAGKSQVDGSANSASSSTDGNSVVNRAVDAINADIGTGCGLSGFAKLLECTYSKDQPILISMKNTGDVVTAIGLIGTTAAWGVKGYAEGAENSLVAKITTGSNPITGGAVGAAKAVLIGFTEMAASLFKTFMFFGMMLGTYLPLLPYIAWLGAVISWLTVVIEGVVAAPLWAFAHLDTDGEGMGQKAQHGYGFLMQVLFRPVLMVVGFLMSAIVMEVVGRFFFATYPLAVSDANTINGWTSILGFTVALAVFFTTSVMIINTCVNLVHIVPDTVLSWIAPGTQAAGAGSQMGGQFGMAAAGVSAYGGGIAQNSMAKVGGAMEKSRKGKNEMSAAHGEALEMNKARGKSGNGASGG